MLTYLHADVVSPVILLVCAYNCQRAELLAQLRARRAGRVQTPHCMLTAQQQQQVNVRELILNACKTSSLCIKLSLIKSYIQIYSFLINSNKNVAFESVRHIGVSALSL